MPLGLATHDIELLKMLLLSNHITLQIMKAVMTDCKRCEGKGTITCTRCSGTGWQLGIISITRSPDCVTCKGIGELRCPACTGSGNVAGFTEEDRSFTDAQQGISQGRNKFGLPDESTFESQLATIVRHNNLVSVMFLDLDNFKSVNDNHNHNVGDQVIRESIIIIQSAIKGKGEMFHRSGDEMLILLPNFDETEACIVGERIRRSVEENNFSTIGSGIVTTTIGVATYPSSCSKWEELSVAADTTAMQAKKLGKNTVIHHSSLSVSPIKLSRKMKEDYVNRALRFPSPYPIVEELLQHMRELKTMIDISIQEGKPASFLLTEINHLQGEINGLHHLSRNDIASQLLLRDAQHELFNLRNSCNSLSPSSPTK